MKWMQTVRASLALTAGVAGLAGCGGSGGSSDAGGSSGGAPIKVALLPPSGGPLAQLGADAVRGWEFAAAEANGGGGIDGHRVEIVKAQTDGTPAGTIRAARKAVTQGGARFVSGIVTSSEHGALQQQLPSMQAISLLGLGKDDALTGESCSPYAFRAVHSTQMQINALTAVLKDLPGKRWAILAVDYSVGHSAAVNFARAAKAAGKEIVLESFSPLNTTDFGPYITKIDRTKPDALFVVEGGADGVTFVKQATQFGLLKRLRTVFGFQMLSEPAVKALGDAVRGFYADLGYDVSADNAKNRSFVVAYRKRYGSAPSSVVADHYLAAQLLFEAVRKAGNVGVAKVRAAMNGLSFDSIVGPVKVAADHQLVRPAYVGKIVERHGELGFQVAATISGEQAQPKPNPACRL